MMFHAYATEAKYECIRALRNPGFAVPFLLLPVALYLLFGVVLFGQAVQQDPNAGRYLMIGFSIFGVMGPGMFGFGITVATERETGLLTLKRALPMPPPAYFIAKMAMAVLFATIVMITMVTSAATIAHVRLTAAQFLSVAGINIAGSLPFCALGLFLGTRVSAKASPAFVNLIYLPMIYLSGLLFPLPKSMEWIARFSPAFYLDQLVLRVTGVPTYGTAMLHVSVLTGLTVILTVLAVRRLVRVG